MHWSNYLPSVLQINDVYWISGVSLAIIAAVRTFPEKYRKPWIVQLITWSMASLFALGLIGSKSVVYALGTALICSSLATSFYDLVFRAIEDKIRAILGQSPDPNQNPTKP